MGKNIIYCTAGTLGTADLFRQMQTFTIYKALGMKPYFAMVTLECISSPPLKSVLFFIYYEKDYYNMHEYLSSTNLVYYDCIECKKRTPHVCIRCHYCYSCHPKIERIEKEIEVKMKSSYKIQKPRFLMYTESDNRYAFNQS